ncbi:unnamed protein product, partial [Prorocentrum cordatum]
RAPVATDTSGRPAGRAWAPAAGRAARPAGEGEGAPSSRSRIWTCASPTTGGARHHASAHGNPEGCGAQRDVLRAAARHPTGLRLDHVRLAQDPDGAVTTERAPPPPLHSRSPGRRMPSRRFTCQLPVVVFLDFTVFMLHRSSAQAHVVHFVELLHCIWPSTQATIELHHFVHSQPY